MRTVVALILAVLAGLTVACSSGKEAAPVPTQLALPPLDPRLQSMGEGRLDIYITPNSKQKIDPLSLARQLGTPPTCADFVFLFSWRIADDQVVRYEGNRQGGAFDISTGASGDVSVGGCIAIDAVNEGHKVVIGEMRYIIAQVRH